LALKGLVDTNITAIANKVSTSVIVNDLTTGGTAVPLSAEQGKSLAASIVSATVAVTDGLTSTSATDALSANQGNVLKGLVDTNISNISSNTSAINTKVTTSAIVDDLTTGGTAVPLSAEQGKALKGLVDTNVTNIATNATYDVTTVTSDYTISTAPSDVYVVDSTSGAMTLTLPTIASLPNGKGRFTISHYKGFIINLITITASGTDKFINLIAGASYPMITTEFATITLTAIPGTGLWIIK
jgi:hypothetical protein